MLSPRLNSGFCESFSLGPGLDADIVKSLHSIGFPSDFPDVAAIARVAKVRVAVHEAHHVGGLRVLPRAAALRDALQDVENVVRLGARHAWAASSFLFSLESAVLAFQARGEVARALFDPSTEDGRREGWQVRGLKAPGTAAMERALRRRLDHWRLDALPGRRCHRLLSNVLSMRQLVPPRPPVEHERLDDSP